MDRFLALLSIGLLIPFGLATAAAKKKASSQSKSATTARSKSAAASSKKAGTRSRRAGAKKRSAHKKVTWRNRQLEPTPERYKAIQEALFKKGYLKTEPDGKWDDNSVDALRRFQQDQNLEATGKLDSLSLIALGLGPRHDAAPPGQTVPEKPKEP